MMRAQACIPESVTSAACAVFNFTNRFDKLVCLVSGVACIDRLKCRGTGRSEHRSAGFGILPICDSVAMKKVNLNRRALRVEIWIPALLSVTIDAFVKPLGVCRRFIKRRGEVDSR